jgi:hypothetical protein
VSVLSVLDRLHEIIEDGVRADGSLPADVTCEVVTILAGLEHDLMPRARGVTCEVCGQWYEWPGLLDAHMYASHWDMPANLAEAA